MERSLYTIGEVMKMIRCNLNTLLAERGLRISKVVNDTHVSRPTLTSIVQNNGKGIQFETLNTLCNYLNVTPCEFFGYIPYDFELEIIDYYQAEGNIKGTYVAFELFITVKDKRKSLIGSSNFIASGFIKNIPLPFDDEITNEVLFLKLDLIDKNVISQVFDTLDTSWKYTIKDLVQSFLVNFFNKKNIEIDKEGIENIFDDIDMT